MFNSDGVRAHQKRVKYVEEVGLNPGDAGGRGIWDFFSRKSS